MRTRTSTFLFFCLFTLFHCNLFSQQSRFQIVGHKNLPFYDSLSFYGIHCFDEYKKIRIALNFEDAFAHPDSVDALWLTDFKGKMKPEQFQQFHTLTNLIFVTIFQKPSGDGYTKYPYFPADSLYLLPALQCIGTGFGMPKNISAFTHLKYLSVYSDYPDMKAVFQMTTLTHLWVHSLRPYSYTDQFEVPAEIGNLSELVSLTIYGGRSLPGSIGKLRKLKQLVLNDCRMLTLPDSICLLDSLEELEIRSVGDSVNGYMTFYLPADFGKLTGLKKLTILSYLNGLPGSFSQLPSLEVLVINPDRDTSMADFPLALATLKSHPQRMMIDFPVASIPEEIALFGYDTTFINPYGVMELWRCSQLKSLPNGICNLKMELDLGVSREFVDISVLNNLTNSFRLMLRGKHLRYRRLFRSLDDGHNLTLILYSNKLPRNIRKLKKLEGIELHTTSYDEPLRKGQKRRIERMKKRLPHTAVIVK
jgi:Leucine-rich repeat (LRR) protein